MNIMWKDGSNESEVYNEETHKYRAYKFFYWDYDEGIILIGPERPFSSTHKFLWDNAKSATPQALPMGAGEVIEGCIMSWRSETYNIDTPTELHEKIAKALGMEDGTIRI
ncbi:MAG: hypothetical protein PHP62_02790 [Candidatus Moranbacteria bacterium]|nr:hypothetical protein [Candidatus Moranbacteria bacterium]